MKIEDLTLDNAREAIGLCIGSTAGYEGAKREKRRWLEKRLPDSAGGKLAYFDEQLAGILEYSLIEDAPFPVTGRDLLHINCIWVLPRFQRREIGKTLINACIQEAKSRGRKGLSVVSYDGVFLMPSTFFLHQGFKRTQIRGHDELMWKEVTPCNPPAFIHSGFQPKIDSRRVQVEILCSPQCPWSVITRQRIEKVSHEFGRKVKVSSITMDDRRVVEKLGESRKVFVNGNESFPLAPTVDDIRKTLSTSSEELGFRPHITHRAG